MQQQRVTDTPIVIATDASNKRQIIDVKFGGSVAFWATKADDKALNATLGELKANIIRVQGEVTKAGLTDHNVSSQASDHNQPITSSTSDILATTLFSTPRTRVLATCSRSSTEQYIFVMTECQNGRTSLLRRTVLLFSWY